MTINLTGRTALFGLSSFVASRVHAQRNPPSNSTPDAAEPVSLEAPAVFDITPTTGTLKETVQKGQQLIWRGKGPNDRRFQVTDSASIVVLGWHVMTPRRHETFPPVTLGHIRGDG
jgi:hypothetical protein